MPATVAPVATAGVPTQPWQPVYRCAGCGALAAAAVGMTFRCPSSDGADHLTTRTLPLTAGALPWPPPAEPQPFVRFRALSSAWHESARAGMGDAEFVELIEDLGAAVERADGAGFRATPLIRLAQAESDLGVAPEGRIFAKVDARNAGGSHKTRHLFGLMTHLLVRERIVERQGLPRPQRPPLAIASCGNAALAAAVVAKAARWPLSVYVPPHADDRILTRLAELGATLHACPRVPGEVGDPCYLRFREAIGAGALPFCCQGTDNGLTIEGGATLAWELACQLKEAATSLDDLVIQVGGGALLSATVQGLREVQALGGLPRLPRFWAVQTTGAWPLRRAWQQALDDIAEARAAAGLPFPGVEETSARMRWVADHWDDAAVDSVRAGMRADRRRYMWPWETEPHSVAEGILDDETYDWRVCVEAMLETGGAPVVVEERLLIAANETASRDAGTPISATDSAGLAGVLHLHAVGLISRTRRVGVLLTGRG